MPKSYIQDIDTRHTKIDIEKNLHSNFECLTMFGISPCYSLSQYFIVHFPVPT
jgi:hypothetical protein